LAAWSTYAQNNAIFSIFISCSVYVHLTQFSYIDKTFFHGNARRKLICQPLCCILILFSLRFVNRNRLSDQCLMYKANGYSGAGGWMFNRSCNVDFLISHYWVVFRTPNPSSRTSFTSLAKVVDRLLFCVLQLLRKGLFKIGRFTSVSAYACFS